MIIEDMLNHIDAKAGAVRAFYITVAPGQEATYLIKGAQARDYIASGYVGPVPNLINAESVATGESAQVSADRIAYEEMLWIGLAGLVEMARRSGKVAICSESTDEEKFLAYQNTISQLNGMIE
jgi:hypothetical protein